MQKPFCSNFASSFRIEKLELFDEFEEWHLIQSHYCFTLAAIDPKPTSAVTQGHELKQQQHQHSVSAQDATKRLFHQFGFMGLASTVAHASAGKGTMTGVEPFKRNINPDLDSTNLVLRDESDVAPWASRDSVRLNVPMDSEPVDGQSTPAGLRSVTDAGASGGSGDPAGGSDVHHVPMSQRRPPFAEFVKARQQKQQQQQQSPGSS